MRQSHRPSGFGFTIALQVAAALVAAGIAPPAFAEPQSARQIDERTDFLVERLEAREPYARRWYRTWLAVYAGGMVVSGVRAGIADGEGARTENIVSAVKSTIGLIDLTLVRPPTERQGAGEITAMPGELEEERVARLVAAENRTETLATRARENRGWRLHLGSLALNLAGGAVLLAGGSPVRAAVSTGLGVVFGELFIWTQPYGFVEDWGRYRERYGAPVRDGITLAPFPGGLALEATF